MIFLSQNTSLLFPFSKAYIECEINTSVSVFFFACLQEIFGPVLTVYVYPDQKYKETLDLVSVFICSF